MSHVEGIKRSIKRERELIRYYCRSVRVRVRWHGCTAAEFHITYKVEYDDCKPGQD